MVLNSSAIGHFARLRLWMASIEGAALVRSMRCFIAQGIIRAVLLALVIMAAGYAAFKVGFGCPKGQTCMEVRK